VGFLRLTLSAFKSGQDLFAANLALGDDRSATVSSGTAASSYPEQEGKR